MTEEAKVTLKLDTAPLVSALDEAEAAAIRLEQALYRVADAASKMKPEMEEDAE